jgi:hypothetical protein
MQFVPVFGQIGGAIIAVGESIKHMLSAHHQAALATEGKTLNDVEPKMLDAMVLVLLGVLQGQITTAAEAKNNLDQIVADYYVQVKSIQRGMWHYTGKKMALDYATVWNHGVNSRDPSPDAHPPDPCNAACLVGHFFAERNSMLVQAVVINALAGKHGELVLPQIPAHATQAGFPEISVFY